MAMAAYTVHSAARHDQATMAYGRCTRERYDGIQPGRAGLMLLAVDTLKRYSKALEYEYRVKTAALGILK
jgi:hypothetical protein